MLSKETLQEIAKVAGLDAEALKTAIASDKEEQLSIKGHLFSDEELATLKTNVSKEAYERGKVAGVEMEFKEIRDSYGVEIEGKDFRKLMEKYGEKVMRDAKLEPSAKITELTNDIKKLQETLSITEKSKNEELTTLKAQMDRIAIESAVKSALPDSAGGLDREDLATLYFGKRQIRKTETGFEIIDTKNNETLKDKMQNPLSLSDDIKAFLEGRKLPTEGRGGKDENNFKTGVESLKSRSSVQEYCTKNNIPLHEQANILQKAMKNEGFDMAR